MDQLAERREQQAGRPLLRCPACDGEWFYLIAYTGDNAGQVTLDTTGRVSGYAGILTCVGCDWEATP